MVAAGTLVPPPDAGAAGGAGQLPVAAFVLPDRTCARSGKVRLGEVPARFSPGEW